MPIENENVICYGYIEAMACEQYFGLGSGLEFEFGLKQVLCWVIREAKVGKLNKEPLKYKSSLMMKARVDVPYPDFISNN